MELLGARYGNLTVLDRTVRRGKVPCRCECGVEKTIGRSRLTSGHVKSCGCRGTLPGRGRTWSDLAPPSDTEVVPGARFGRLTALTIPYSEPGSRNRLAQVRCDCGTEKVVVAGHLLSGRSKSCGCLRADGARVLNQAN